MSCERTPLLGRFLVQDPDVLENLDWAGHLEECPSCRQERKSFSRSLTVYGHLERLQNNEAAYAPDWSRFSHRLESESRRLRRASTRAPWFYGLAGVLVVGTLVSGGMWLAGGDDSRNQLAVKSQSAAAVPIAPIAQRPVAQPAERLAKQIVVQPRQQVPDRLLQQAIGKVRPLMSRKPNSTDVPLEPLLSRRAQAELLEMALFPNGRDRSLAGSTWRKSLEGDHTARDRLSENRASRSSRVIRTRPVSALAR